MKTLQPHAKASDLSGGIQWMKKRVFRGEYESLEEICDYVVELAKQADLDKRSIYAVQLAVTEASENIIQHAYGGENKGDIECACEIDEECLTVVLRDWGEPFDPEKVPTPNFNVALEELDVRGAGLIIMQKSMDEVGFSTEKSGANVLTMKKNRSR
jgi:serine/threonine-protein kinase RsbW